MLTPLTVGTVSRLPSTLWPDESEIAWLPRPKAAFVVPPAILIVPPFSVSALAATRDSVRVAVRRLHGVVEKQPTAGATGVIARLSRSGADGQRELWRAGHGHRTVERHPNG